MIETTICITTCNRPALLRETIDSCLAQTLPAAQILIGDDSRNTETEAMISSLAMPSNIALRYVRHPRSLGQNDNMNFLYQNVTTSHLILMHDDDLLLPNALADLTQCWSLHGDLAVAYGKQYVITPTGTIDYAASDRLNADYYRTADRQGIQPYWFPGLVQQLPNDGFMIRADVARETLWRSKAAVGTGGEFDFGLRVSLRKEKIFFLDTFTAKYRLSDTDSISTSTGYDAALQIHRMLKALPLPVDAEPYRKKVLGATAAAAIMQAAQNSKREALEIYWSASHPWRDRLSLGGARRLLRCMRPW